MKKVFHIFFSILVLVATLHISVAIHFCEGKDVARKVSFSGKFASCGMRCRDEGKTPVPGTNYTKNCCDNTLVFCGTSTNYSGSCSFIPEPFRHCFNILSIPPDLSAKSQNNNNNICSGASPPGALMSTDVDLNSICVFRI